VPRKRISGVLASAASLFLTAALPSGAANPEAATLQAWEGYVTAVKQRTAERFEHADSFLMIDKSPDGLRRVRKGEVLAWPAITNGRSQLAGGLVHHWNGAIFIANTNLDTVFDILDDYESYERYFRPTVVAASLINGNGSHRQFSMRLVRRVMFVTAAVEAQYDSVHYRNGGPRWYSVTQSTRIQEIENFGQPSQRLLAPDSGNGYIWRLYGVSRFEERDGGVYIEVEAMALTRAVPAYTSWLLNPVITRLSKNAILTSLTQMREAAHVYSRPVQQLVRR
jgi:hypothetical protein